MESVFVSSTFRDMHKERDILNSEVLPKLNLILSKEGKSIFFSDLRWGIDTTGLSEAESMKRILDICDNEIERCKPYIIVLLGDRYGTSIPSGLIPDKNKTRVGKSVTHVEVQKGVFQNVEREHIFIYFRDLDYTDVPEEIVSLYKDTDENDARKLADLKSKLVSEYGDRVKTYHAKWDCKSESIQSDDFEQIVFDDFKKHIEEYIINQSVCGPEYLFQVNKNLVDTNIFGIDFPEDKISSATKEIINNIENSVILGECGCGKTAFLSKLYDEFQKKRKAIVFFFGHNEYSSSVLGFAEYILFNLLNSCEIEEDDKEYNANLYSEVIKRTASLRKFVDQEVFIFVDNIAHCDDIKLLSSYVNWLRFYFSDKIKFVFACDDIELINSVLGKSIGKYELEYNNADGKSMIRSLLIKNKKNLNDEIIELISQRYLNPLIIQLLITRLVNLKENDYVKIDQLGGGIIGINKYLRDIINNAPGRASDLLYQIIDILFDDSERKQIFYVLNLLSVSDRGIRERDLRGLLNAKNIMWSNITHANMLAKIGFAFVSNGEGVLDFAHYSLKESFYPDDIMETYNEMMSFYADASEEDVWAIEEFFKYSFVCENQEFIIRFIMDKCIWSDGSKSKQICRKVAAKTIEDANENGRGMFLFSVFEKCKNRDQQFHYLELIKHSLIQNRNLVKRKSVIDNVSLLLSMIDKIDDYPKVLLQSDCVECKRYLQRNNSIDLIEQVESFFAERISKRETENSISNSDNAGNLLFELYLVLCMSKELTANKQYEENERVVKQLLEKAEMVSDRTMEYYIFVGDCYKELGNSLKCQHKWEEAIYYDTKYLSLYREKLNTISSEVIDERYRVGLFNIANVYESMALANGDQALWSKVEELFEKSYDSESIAIAFVNNDQGFLDSFSSIFSYSMALLQTGNISESVDVFFAATSFIKRNASTKESDYLNATIAMYELDYLLQGILLDNGLDVRTISQNIVDYLSDMFSDEKCGSNQLLQAWKTFDSKVSKGLGDLFNCGELEKASLLCAEYVFIANRISEYFDAPQLFVQLVIICKNWADINYNVSKNYKVSENACKEMISIIRNNNLVVLFAQIGLGEQLADFICTATARIVNSLVFQDRKEEAINYLTDNYHHISSLAPITDNYQRLPAYLVYSLARNIEDSKIKNICADYAIQIALAANEELDRNRKIIIMCDEIKKHERTNECN